MATVSVPISEASHRVLLELASRGGEPIGKIAEKAIEEYRRQKLLDEANAAYSALRADKQAWQDELSERRRLPYSKNDGRCIPRASREPVTGRHAAQRAGTSLLRDQRRP